MPSHDLSEAVDPHNTHSGAYHSSSHTQPSLYHEGPLLRGDKYSEQRSPEKVSQHYLLLCDKHMLLMINICKS